MAIKHFRVFRSYRLVNCIKAYFSSALSFCTECKIDYNTLTFTTDTFLYKDGKKIRLAQSFPNQGNMHVKINNTGIQVTSSFNNFKVVLKYSGKSE